MFLFPYYSSSPYGFKRKFSTPYLSQFSSRFLSHSLLKDLLLYTLPMVHFLCELEVLPRDTGCFSLPSDYFPWALGKQPLSIPLLNHPSSHPCGLGGANLTFRLVADMHPTWPVRARPKTSAATVAKENLPLYWGRKQSWRAQLFSYICQNILSFLLSFSVAMLIYKNPRWTHDVVGSGMHTKKYLTS